MSIRKSIKYSQNFLVDPNLVDKLLDLVSLSKEDTVLEIGAGEGIITKALLDKCKKVIAYEIDKQLVKNLNNKFFNQNNLELRNEDFLNQTLPKFPYKVFSNIPFNVTSAVIKKLTLGENSPQEAYLIVQKEAAIKFLGKPYDNKNSQVSVLLYPFFELEIIHVFEKTDFSPVPNINIVLLGIKKRKQSLVSLNEINMCRDFVSYTYTRSKTSSFDFSHWLALFNEHKRLPDIKKRKVQGWYTKLLKEQDNLEKIHRTRVDKNWRNYK